MGNPYKLQNLSQQYQPNNETTQNDRNIAKTMTIESRQKHRDRRVTGKLPKNVKNANWQSPIYGREFCAKAAKTVQRETKKHPSKSDYNDKVTAQK